jgi:hypothetical protein
MVKREFDGLNTVFRLHIPNAQFGDDTGIMAKERIFECDNELRGSGIQFIVDQEYKTPEELTRWLAMNDLNIFNCMPSNGRGISSSIDYALAARRPIGISNSEMYRHLPREICVDNISLPHLIAKGIEPLKKVYEDNSNEKLIEAMTEWLKK